MYMVANEIDKAGLTFCCLQEVRQEVRSRNKQETNSTAKWESVRIHMVWKKEKARCRRRNFNQSWS